MRKQFITVAVATCFVIGLFAMPALGDWDPSMPAKWVQLPDPTGFDVNATWKGQYPFVKVLADDWMCKSRDAISDIHIWGSWLNDEVFTGAQFKLSIHKDVPAGVDAPYSHPSPQPVWQRILGPGQYTFRPEPTGQTERFYDPNTNQIIGTDHVIFQYNFTDIPEPFIQEGTAANPVIYWLDVQAWVPATSPYVFGWKTTRDPHQLDDAVFADTAGFGGPVTGPAPGPVFWKDMYYPAGTAFHPTGESMDLAFVIAPEPHGLALLALAGLALRRRQR